MEETKLLNFIMDKGKTSIIKVIGVGGGGGNAVNHMFRQGIHDVAFVVCNTDKQALDNSPIPLKIRLGNKELGAGNNPEVARQAAEDSIEEIKTVLRENTQMVFITAGMGGGTGTGAAPIVAKAAKEMGILTVGIVTIPFRFEGKRKIEQAFQGIDEIRKYVDALLVINNEKLYEIYPDLGLDNAFAKADDILAGAAKGIAEIITVHGYINVDFADVDTIMRNGGVAIMNSGYGEGEHRITEAIKDALHSPLLNNSNIRKAKKILINLYTSKSNVIKMDRIEELTHFMNQMEDENIEVIWGATFNEELGDKVKITIIATGFDVHYIADSGNDNTDLNEDDDDIIYESGNDEYEEEIINPQRTITFDIKAEKEKTISNFEKYYGTPKKEEKNDTAMDVESLDNEDYLQQLTEEPAYKRNQNMPS